CYKITFLGNTHSRKANALHFNIVHFHATKSLQSQNERNISKK
ncbi:hypothetical protein X975_03048, partial [Stegodyphus mimosarum]